MTKIVRTMKTVSCERNLTVSSIILQSSFFVLSKKLTTLFSLEYLDAVPNIAATSPEGVESADYSDSDELTDVSMMPNKH